MQQPSITENQKPNVITSRFILYYRKHCYKTGISAGNMPNTRTHRQLKNAGLAFYQAQSFVGTLSLKYTNATTFFTVIFPVKTRKKR